MKANSKRRKDLRMATWNVRSLYITGGLRMTSNTTKQLIILTVRVHSPLDYGILNSTGKIQENSSTNMFENSITI
jgi:hypothetical protein